MRLGCGARREAAAAPRGQPRRDDVALRRGPLREQLAALRRARDDVRHVGVRQVALQRRPRRGERRDGCEQRREPQLDKIDDGGADRREQRQLRVATCRALHHGGAQRRLVAVRPSRPWRSPSRAARPGPRPGVPAEAGEQRGGHGEQAARRRRQLAGGIEQRERAGGAGGDARRAVHAQVVAAPTAGRRAPGWRRWGRRPGSDGSPCRGRRRRRATTAARRAPRLLAAARWRSSRACPRPTVDVTRSRSLLRSMLGRPMPAPKPSARASADAVDQPSVIALSMSAMPGPWSTTSTSSWPSLTVASRRPPSAWITTFISAS